jgi:hypothetical protein
MTRTGVMASSRPRTAGAASNRSGSSRLLRGLTLLPALLVLALAPGVAAAATEPTSGYTTPSTTTTSTEPTSSYTTPSTTTTAKSEIKPSTTPTTTTSPSTGTLPSKESEEPKKTTPASEPAASNTSTTPKSSTLPFTGFDLRWDVGFGLLLLVAGFSIVGIQRRQRRDGGR